MQLWMMMIREARADSRERIAAIRADAEVSKESERMRAEVMIRLQNEHWQAVREHEREVRQAAERRYLEERERADDAMESSQEAQDELDAKVEELAARLARTGATPSPSALETLRPLVESLGPVLLPKVIEWIGGSPPPGRGSLGGDGRGGEG